MDIDVIVRQCNELRAWKEEVDQRLAALEKKPAVTEPEEPVEPEEPAEHEERPARAE